jgi:D-glutamate cyclase
MSRQSTNIADYTDPAAAQRLERLGETLDQIMTIDIAGRGAVSALYQAARAQAGGPLSVLAASRLASSVKAGDTVILATGFPVRPWLSPAIGETDGPPGVAALAWALSKGLDCIPTILAPPGMLEQVKRALNAVGVLVVERDEAKRAVSASRPTLIAVVRGFPTDAGAAAEAAEQILRELQPVAVIAVEHPGANSAGVYHSSVGVDISAGTARADELFRRARERGILSISFTDMPNEIGSGAIRPTALDQVPYAARCQCPCGAGMASASLVDLLLVSTTANWGAYAAVTALSVILNDPSLCFSRAQDARAIAGALAGGAVEGLSGSLDPEAGVDGVPTLLSGHIVELLNASARSWYGLEKRAAF